MNPQRRISAAAVPGRPILLLTAAVALAALAVAALSGSTSRAAAAAPTAAAPTAAAPTAAASDSVPPPIRHVFIIVLENESASTTFGANSPAPYLARTLRSEGAYLPRYYGTGHESNDNYISMISGQPPNPANQADCQFYGNFRVAATGPYGAQTGIGCIYPANIQTIAGQLDRAHRTWRDYNEDMGNTPSREASRCGHPAVNSRDGTQTGTAQDQYATRHNPFVYFHSIIDNKTLCDTHVVNLKLLPHDLKRAASTPNYVYITPNLCHDGHDSPCKDGEPGGLRSVNGFLKKWVPRITSSPAFRQQNGLLIITFDEAAASDASSCCGEIPGPGSPAPGIIGPGGGDTGAVLLSPCIKPRTVSEQPYNHYTMLRSVEDIFHLSHLGYAQLPGERSFGPDVFTRRCNGRPVARISVPRTVRAANRRGLIPVRWSSRSPGATFTVAVRGLRGGRAGGWRTLRRNTHAHRMTYTASAGRTYQFRVRARSGVGITGRWASRRVRVI
ncbi:MAG TPA: alkaline phosphatase family protein [Solirubrobacteraceae bacterium]|nr:alkaline phosphatase family protein [Solirubrobacteraceae bacterium]